MPNYKYRIDKQMTQVVRCARNKHKNKKNAYVYSATFDFFDGYAIMQMPWYVISVYSIIICQFEIIVSLAPCSFQCLDVLSS